ncbi:MAG: N-acetyltransferase [Verrucomicrobia bacterium]|nr:MAG: N-acetyltransferase [Verrucomicrobiota bacterium]
MELSIKMASVEEILPWRDLYRQEMNCQIVCDALDSRKGWTQPYLLVAGAAIAGFGSVAVGGPWQGKSTVFAFYVLPQYRSRVFDLFSALLTASGATMIEAQTNDSLLSVMLHTFTHNIASESILFHDKLTTTHSPPGAIFRRATPDDAVQILSHDLDSGAKWAVEFEGTIAAAGDILFHYNRPYGDIYMKVAEPFQRRGLGAYLVQELKRIGYESGNVPAARCNPMRAHSDRFSFALNLGDHTSVPAGAPAGRQRTQCNPIRDSVAHAHFTEGDVSRA